MARNTYLIWSAVKDSMRQNPTGQGAVDIYASFLSGKDLGFGVMVLPTKTNHFRALQPSWLGMFGSLR